MAPYKQDIFKGFPDFMAQGYVSQQQWLGYFERESEDLSDDIELVS